MKKKLGLLIALLMLTLPGHSQQLGPVGMTQQTTLNVSTPTGPVSTNGVTILGQQMGVFTLTWVVTGSVSSCVIEVDSNNGTVWTTGGLIGTKNCATTGGQTNFVTPSSTFTAVRLRVATALTAGDTGSVNVTLMGFANTPNPIAAPTAVSATTSPSCIASGSTILVGATTGEVVTLPAPVPGCRFHFIITVTNTSNSNEIQTDSASHFLLGTVDHAASGIAPLNFWANGTTTQALKMNGSTTGGLIGSSFDVIATSGTVWEMTGTNLCTATCTTAFTATP